MNSYSFTPTSQRITTTPNDQTPQPQTITYINTLDLHTTTPYWPHQFSCNQTRSYPRLVMEEVAYSLVSSLDDASKCEQILQDFLTHRALKEDPYCRNGGSLLDYFITTAPNHLFRRLFHVNKDTIGLLAEELCTTRAFLIARLDEKDERFLSLLLSVSILYLNSSLSMRACSYFSGITIPQMEGYLNLFNKMMNEMKDKVIRFPSLNCQNLLKVNGKRFFPGAVGVVGLAHFHL